MKNKIALFGILVIVLIGLTVSSAAARPIPSGKDVIVWLEPDPSSAPYGEDVSVELWLNTSQTLVSWADFIYFDPDCVDITAGVCGNLFTDACEFHHWGDYVRIGGVDPDFCEPTTGEILLMTLTVECNCTGACMSELYHHPDHQEMFNCDFDAMDTEWAHGTFTCEAAPETYETTLVPGWNLISLPLLNDTDMSVANIIDTSLGGSYDELYRYDASANSYVSMGSSNTMANGVGYFINMTTEDTWTYSGTAYGVMNEGYSGGLNMIGWLSCTKAISATGLDDSAKTYYISRWNADTQEYETYNPVAPGDFNDFTQMDPGEGYFISMKTDGTLSESC